MKEKFCTLLNEKILPFLKEKVFIRANLPIFLIVLFSIIFLVSGYFLVDYLIESKREKDLFDDLAGLVEGIQETDYVDRDNVLIEITDPKTGEPMQILEEYAEVYTRNTDMVGWMRIDDTVLNYPVMQTPENQDYYINHNFNKQSSSHGCLYARDVCDVSFPSDNVTIFGHNMRDGSMFAVLHSYKDPAFFESHRYIHFDSLTHHRKYEVMAVFLTTATEDQGFAYHQFVDAQNEPAFDEFVSLCKSISLYDTGVTAQYGDKLITLSTCEYSQTNGRLAVVARLVYD